jgi:hypothetical protein
MRNEFLGGGEPFVDIDDAKYVVERWRMNYNHHRQVLQDCVAKPVVSGRIWQRSME